MNKVSATYLALGIFLLCHACKCQDNETSVVEEEEELPCPTHMSIYLEGAEQDFEDNMLYREHVFPPGSYFKDENNKTRGCMCQIAPESKPCLRKCCKYGMSITPDSIKKLCLPDPNLDRLNQSLVIDVDRMSSEMKLERETKPELGDWFTVFPTIRCPPDQRLFRLNPFQSRDEYSEMLPDGRLWILARLQPTNVGEFCVDRKIGDSDDKLWVVACGEEEDEEGETNLLKYGSFVSVPLLAITFIVYAIIPELRNNYGKTLMCYVLALGVGNFGVCLMYAGDRTVSLKCTIIDKRSPEKKYSEDCGKYEVYNTCGSGCEKTCSDLNNDDHTGERACSAVCVKKCTCQSGYVREKEDGRCIRIQECPRVKH